MDNSDRILRNPSITLAPGEDGYLAYDIKSHRLHRLNPAAALIVELSDGTRNEAEICAELTPILGASGLDACVQWIATARAEGLLQYVEANAELPDAPSAKDLREAARDLRAEGYVLAAFVCQHYAVSLAPDDARQWRYLGDLAHIVGRREDARAAYERYLALHPQDPEIEHILVSLRDEAPPPRAPNRCIEQLYSRFAEFYEENMCEDLEYRGPEHLNEALEAELGTLGDLEVLDIGCGTGLVGRYLRPRARRLAGIDLSPEMVAHARKTNFYDTLEVAEITEWLARPNAADFNLITACDTFIYFGNLRQVIVPAARRLRPGGWLGFTVERSDTAPDRMNDNGRFSHSSSHIADAANDAGLSVSRITECVLRYEYGAPVTALVVILRRL
jgi:predicted TPR repeat methyltransferase